MNVFLEAQNQALKETLDSLKEKKKTYLLQAIRQRKGGQEYSSDVSFTRALEYDRQIKAIERLR